MKKMMIYENIMSETESLNGSVEPELLRVSALIERLVSDGFDIVRYNLPSAPTEFEENKLVNEALKKEGASILPITIVDDVIMKTGSYPSNEEFVLWVELADLLSQEPEFDEFSHGCGGCCTGCCSEDCE